MAWWLFPAISTIMGGISTGFQNEAAKKQNKLLEEQAKRLESQAQRERSNAGTSWLNLAALSRGNPNVLAAGRENYSQTTRQANVMESEGARVRAEKLPTTNFMTAVLGDILSPKTAAKFALSAILANINPLKDVTDTSEPLPRPDFKDMWPKDYKGLNNLFGNITFSDQAQANRQLLSNLWSMPDDRNDLVNIFGGA